MTEELRIRAARRRRFATCFALMLTAAGCSGAPLPAITSGPDPADAQAGAAPATYRPVTAGTVNHQPVEPKPWREMNERVAPRAGRSP